MAPNPTVSMMLLGPTCLHLFHQLVFIGLGVLPPLPGTPVTLPKGLSLLILDTLLLRHRGSLSYQVVNGKTRVTLDF